MNAFLLLTVLCLLLAGVDAKSRRVFDRVDSSNIGFRERVTGPHTAGRDKTGKKASTDKVYPMLLERQRSALTLVHHEIL